MPCVCSDVSQLSEPVMLRLAGLVDAIAGTLGPSYKGTGGHSVPSLQVQTTFMLDGR